MSARPHTVSPYRTALEIVAQGRSSRSPAFGITEEKGPGGIVLPLFRAEVPVCDEFPTADDAYSATIGYYHAFLGAFPRNGES